MRSYKLFALLVGISVVVSGCGGIEITIKEEGGGTKAEEASPTTVQQEPISGGKQPEAVPETTVKLADDNAAKPKEADSGNVEKPKEEASYAVEETSAEQSIDYMKPTSSEINMRVAPSIHGRSVKVLYKDEEVVYLHRKNYDPTDGRTWYQVSTADGSIGWVSSKVVMQSDGRYYEGDTSVWNEAEYLTVTVAHANMREVPSINGAAVAVVDKGDRLEHWGGSVYDPTDGRTWYEVWTSGGKYGWISGKVIDR
ncbi:MULTISPECIES: SH3 domain-containing protein [unclassified Paenibacillus]|uniref:SH3 domain-containing protein n=1 Tax=unclassified Paenibacillus TaxID=185978 RepID=UPI001F2BE6F7|nr:SH3 domain-containing protein [Paenibacillus sp. JJ-223]CAH1224606.1 hypothetical protein PAECIP111890_05700 [Paenibacillus sp. JJ-223]